VDEILTKWWNQVGASDHEETPSRETKSRSRPLKSKKRKIQTKTDSTGDAAGQSESSYDPNTVANEIKERADFSKIERKVLHTRDRYNKVALILWLSDAPLTSGQIHRTLEALDVRISLPHVSTSLKQNISKFLTSSKRQAGGQPASYRLSAQAKTEFENWLRQDGQ
jgi:hypothetical protein